MKPRIVQIIPADGWRVDFKQIAGSSEVHDHAKVLAWALTETGELRGVILSQNGERLELAEDSEGPVYRMAKE